jgi:hypothetical protein
VLFSCVRTPPQNVLLKHLDAEYWDKILPEILLSMLAEPELADALSLCCSEGSMRDSNVGPPLPLSSFDKSSFATDIPVVGLRVR